MEEGGADSPSGGPSGRRQGGCKQGGHLQPFSCLSHLPLRLNLALGRWRQDLGITGQDMRPQEEGSACAVKSVLVGPGLLDPSPGPVCLL